MNTPWTCRKNVRMEWECACRVGMWVQGGNVWSTAARHCHVWRLTVTRSLIMFWQNVHRPSEDRCMFVCLLSVGAAQFRYAELIYTAAPSGRWLSHTGKCNLFCMSEKLLSSVQIAFAIFSKQAKTCNEILQLISLSVSFNSTMLIAVQQGSKAGWTQAAAYINKPVTKPIYKLRSQRQAIWYPCSK